MRWFADSLKLKDVSERPANPLERVIGNRPYRAFQLVILYRLEALDVGIALLTQEGSGW